MDKHISFLVKNQLKTMVLSIEAIVFLRYHKTNTMYGGNLDYELLTRITGKGGADDERNRSSDCYRFCR